MFSGLIILIFDVFFKQLVPRKNEAPVYVIVTYSQNKTLYNKVFLAYFHRCVDVFKYT